MEYYPLQQPAEIPEREKEDAMGAYLMMFAAVAVGLPLPIINLIASVIYYYVNRKKSRFIHFHALQSLLSNIPTTLINWGVVFWGIGIALRDDWKISPEFWAYAIFAAVCSLIYFIVGIVAAFRARQGKMYYFLFFGKIAYESAYRIREQDLADQQAIVNKPPF